MMGEAKRRGIIVNTTRLSYICDCLNCGVEIDAATSVGHKHLPKEGAIAICIVCSHIMAYDKNLHLRELTDDEMLKIAGSPEIIFLINGLGGAKAAWENKNGKGTWGQKARERLAKIRASRAQIQ
jgi:hypothetical protein